MPISKNLFTELVSNFRWENKEINFSTLKSPLKIYFSMLKNDESLAICSESNDVSFEISSIIANIWKPNPRTAKDIETKKIFIKNFPNIIKQISIEAKKKKKRVGDIKSFIKEKNHHKNPINQISEILMDLNKKFDKSKERMSKKWSITANPFLTSTVANTWEDGVNFQIGAKTASSIETIWGNWIESAIYAYNQNLFYIGAGGMDFVQGNIAYDVKSGPQVMNKDQVEEAKKKNRYIQEANSNKKVQEVFGISEFKVAICYGNRELAWPFMAKAGNLIIYGPETWDILTGDEWNAFHLFLSGIKYKIAQGSQWSIKELDNAIDSFIKSFYNGDKAKKEIALNFQLFKEIKNEL